MGRKFTGAETGHLKMSQPSALSPSLPVGQPGWQALLTVGTPHSARSEVPGALFGALSCLLALSWEDRAPWTR